MMLKHFGVVLVTLLVFDGLWLGLVMTGFYRRHLAHLARMADGGLDPIWPIAALVYPLLATGITVLVLARARTPLEALALGALFGAVTYGVYDLTNHATLHDWPATMTIVDIAWGTSVCAAASWIAAMLVRTGP